MADERWTRFAKVVKFHRNRTDLSQPALARSIHVGESTIAAYETGRRAPNRTTAQAIDQALSAGGAILHVWDELTDEREIPEDWRNFEKVEQQATEIREYQNVVVPGLLQTVDYARQCLQNLRLWNDERIEHLVRQRTQRLEAVSAVSLTFVVDEIVLRRAPGSPKVLHAQLDHLIELVSARVIWLSVLPTDTLTHPGVSSFRIMTLADGRLVGHEEYISGVHVATGPQANGLVTLFGSLQAEALSTRESAKLIESIGNAL
ncbi:helix-turn-helix transcriptional regulator [Lipingzhangella sp. LS1_29]|uniref:Helix-turn-helix transcriptional regulator n=1 Tax=Lipingzhangella rawalii TaxID=2055835 RepID=A0ABU2H951_9ACTN|nr:helix-turn-helix transcriptional regulator [Lipingzhangella rawalii]MDS1271816.1 helix-turn-helix transcriptional regulator [Lipingzhangella rawalii]